MFGVCLGAAFKTWNIYDPSALLALLLSTTLAPIAGEFGWIAGMIAGFLHSSVALNIGIVYGGMNLYNNGFAGGMVDYSAYDATFAQACVGESEEKLCRMALARLLAPFALSENARADYEFYLTGHPDAAFALAIAERRETALRLLVGLGLDVREAAARCARASWSAGATILLARPKRAAKQYDFDDL